jgi:hypothetical protein
VGEFVVAGGMPGELLLQEELRLTKSNMFGIIGIDSITRVAPEGELAKDLDEEAKMAAKANLKNKFFDQYHHMVTQLDAPNYTTLLMLGQARANMSAQQYERKWKPVEAGAKAKHHAGFFVKLIDSRKLTRAELRVGYDFVFIDGGHDYETVKHDSELALQLVGRGGIIAWHDYNDNPANGVKTVVDKINSEVGGRVVKVEGTWLCFLWV